MKPNKRSQIQSNKQPIPSNAKKNSVKVSPQQKLTRSKQEKANQPQDNIQSASSIPQLQFPNFRPFNRQIQKNNVLVPGGASKRRASHLPIVDNSQQNPVRQTNFDVLDGLQNASQTIDPQFDRQPQGRTDNKNREGNKKHYSLMSNDPKIQYEIVRQNIQNMKSNAGQILTQNPSKHNNNNIKHQKKHHQPLQRNLANVAKKKSFISHEGDSESQANRRKAQPIAGSEKQHGIQKKGTQSSFGSNFTTPIFNLTMQVNVQILRVSKNRPISAGEYDSIQTAIDDALPQSIILVSPGIYLQPIQITQVSPLQSHVNTFTIRKPIKIISQLFYNEMCNKSAQSNASQKLGINNSTSDQHTSRNYDFQHHNLAPQTKNVRQNSLSAEQASVKKPSVIGSASIPDFPSSINSNQNQKVYILSSKGPAITIQTNVKNQMLEPTHSPYVQLCGVRIGHLGPKEEGTQIIKLSLVQNPCPDLFRQFDIIQQDRIECGVHVKSGYLSMTDCIVSLGTIPITMNLKLSCILAMNGTRVHLNNTTVRGHRIHPTSGIVILNSDYVKIQNSKIYQCPSGGILCRGSTTDFIQVKDCLIRDCALAGMYFLGESQDEFKLRRQMQEEQLLKYSLNRMSTDKKRYIYQAPQDLKIKEKDTNIWQTQKIFNVFRASVLRSQFKNIQGDGISTSWGVYGIVGGCKFDLCRVAVRC